MAYESHEYYLRRCIEISRASREGGNTPFGALLVDSEGNTLTEVKTPQMVFRMRLPKAVPPMSFIRRAADLSAKD